MTEIHATLRPNAFHSGSLPAGGSNLSEAGRKRRRMARPGLQLLFEDSLQPMLVVDTRTLRFLQVNQAAIGKYGYGADEFLSMRLTDIVPLADLSRVTDAIRKDQLDVSGFCQTRYLLKNGQVQLITAGHLTHPNGIAVSADEKFLYINDSAKRQV